MSAPSRSRSPASRARSPRTPCWRPIPAPSRGPVPRFDDVARAVDAGEVAPACCRSRTSSSAPCARSSTCCSTQRGRRRRGHRARAPLPRRAARAAARRHRARVLAHPGARAGRGVPAHPTLVAARDDEHGRRGQDHRRARRARLGGGALAASRGAVRPRGPRRRHPVRPPQPDAVPGARRAGSGPASAGAGDRRSDGSRRTTLAFSVRNEPGTLHGRSACSPTTA